MDKIPQEAMDLFTDRESSKVLATVDASGKPNVAAKGSLTALSADTLAFADIAGGKTRANLEATGKVAVAVSKGRAGYQVKGTLQEFQTSGPIFDSFSKALAPMQITPKAVGIIKVEEVFNLSPNAGGKKDS